MSGGWGEKSPPEQNPVYAPAHTAVKIMFAGAISKNAIKAWQKVPLYFVLYIALWDSQPEFNPRFSLSYVLYNYMYFSQCVLYYRYVEYIYYSLKN